MPIIYLKYGDSKTDSYFIQTNNPTEEKLRKEGIEDYADVAEILNGKTDSITLERLKKRIQDFLESCGPTSGTMLCGATKSETAIAIRTPGGYLPQPEEVLSDYLNDPANYDKFRKVASWFDPTILPGNRAAVYYPIAVWEVFGIRCKFVGSLTYDQVVACIKNNQGVQIVLKNPGHFLAIVGVDTDRKELIYNDSWPNRHPDRNGYHKRMTLEEYTTNVKDSTVIYNVPELS